MKCRKRYEMTEAIGGGWRHTYIVENAHGAVHFHLEEYDSTMAERIGERYGCGGLECHYRVPPYYMADDPPSHHRCEILGGSPCWHDGTSLYATEVLTPRWQARLGEAEFLEALVGELHRLTPSREGT